MRVNIRLKGEAETFFLNRQAEWHTDNTATFHKIVSDYNAVLEMNRKLATDNETLRDYVANRPTQTPQDKAAATPTRNTCLRGLNFMSNQKEYFCRNCQQRFNNSYETCQKLNRAVVEQ